MTVDYKKRLHEVLTRWHSRCIEFGLSEEELQEEFQRKRIVLWIQYEGLVEEDLLSCVIGPKPREITNWGLRAPGGTTWTFPNPTTGGVTWKR